MKTLLKYFSVFVFKKILGQWANWTNANAAQDKKIFDKIQAQKKKILSIKNTSEYIFIRSSDVFFAKNSSFTLRFEKRVYDIHQLSLVFSFCINAWTSVLALKVFNQPFCHWLKMLQAIIRGISLLTFKQMVERMVLGAKLITI